MLLTPVVTASATASPNLAHHCRSCIGNRPYCCPICSATWSHTAGQDNRYQPPRSVWNVTRASVTVATCWCPQAPAGPYYFYMRLQSLPAVPAANLPPRYCASLTHVPTTLSHVHLLAHVPFTHLPHHSSRFGLPTFDL